jgi:hypothetical protein
MPVTGHPPHGSRRARFAHRALASGGWRRSVDPARDEGCEPAATTPRTRTPAALSSWHLRWGARACCLPPQQRRQHPGDYTLLGSMAGLLGDSHPYSSPVSRCTTVFSYSITRRSPEFKPAARADQRLHPSLSRSGAPPATIGNSGGRRRVRTCDPCRVKADRAGPREPAWDQAMSLPRHGPSRGRIRTRVGHEESERRRG